MPINDSVVVGYEGADDAAAVRLNSGKTLIQTVDFFTPIVDDPYEFGLIAAANALSDIYAMGGKPLFALNIVGFPINDLPKSILSTILQGGADKAAEAGIPIVGGHSVDDKEPKYGMVVTGEVDEASIWTNSGAQVGDTLILTKALGTGVVATAIKKGLASVQTITSAVDSMKTLNKEAAKALNGLKVNAVTDVTGYGLLGHLQEMCHGSQVSARIDFSLLNFLPGVRDLAEAGLIAGGTRRNLKHVSDQVNFGENLSETDRLLAADAQTSGGLLVSLPSKDAEEFLSIIAERTHLPAFKIGQIRELDHHSIKID